MLMMKKLALAFGLIALPTAALAQPTYLSCEFPGRGSPFIVNVTADEQAGTVSLYMPSTDNRQQMTGTFTSDRVLFADRVMTYALSRVDLTLIRTVTMIKAEETGTCKIMLPPKRAF